MSNATNDSRNSGDSRRRRSRGGSNRNQNRDQRNDNQGDRRSDDRGSRNERGPSQGRRQEGALAEEFHPQSPRPARKYAPPKLTFWQKILKAVGLYKDPAPPSRYDRDRAPAPAKADADARPPKSNTRNARSDERPPREPREPREQREPREPREQRQDGERPPRRERPPRTEKPRGGDPSTVESSRVYVGNLSYDVTEQDLQELFKGVGPVRNVEIVYNRSTHRSKGYGFVEMLRRDEAVRAVEVLHDQHFMGRPMTVSGAKGKGQDERDDQEERSEPKPVVLAPSSPPAVEEQVAAGAEPGLEETSDPTGDAGGTEIADVTADDLASTDVPHTATEEIASTDVPDAPADDLTTKYGFDEPSEKPDQA